MEDPDGDYTMHGHFYIKGWLSGMGQLQGTRLGKHIMTFKDGSQIQIIQDPVMNVTGLLKGPQQQNYIKKAIFIDTTYLIKAEVNFNPWKDNSYKGMLKGAGGMVSGAVKWGLGRKKKVDETQAKKRSDDITV